MTRRTVVSIDADALLHNIHCIRALAPQSKLIAMVKANAYGCGVAAVIPVIDGYVDGFGVACLEEALAIRALGAFAECVLFEGVFEAEEYQQVVPHHFQCVIHHHEQVQWLLETPLPEKIKLWIKVDTGMHRLGFLPEALPGVIKALLTCPWVDANFVMMTHFASAEEVTNPVNQLQLASYRALDSSNLHVLHSLANSAAIMTQPETHVDWVRPGIMLYGASPFRGKTGQALGLKPVMHFTARIIALHEYPAGEAIGYGGTWKTTQPSLIGVVGVGYGDGYPRHIAANTPVGVHGQRFPVVGRVSMDMLTVDLTACKQAVSVGDEVELWGSIIPIEVIAEAAGTIPYELMCQVTSRVYR